LHDHVTLVPGVRIYAGKREGVIYDSRLVPATQDESPGDHVFYVLLDGVVIIRRPVQDGAPVEERVEAPAMIHAGADFIDGRHGTRPLSFVNYGWPTKTMMMWISRDAAGRVALPETPTVHKIPSHLHEALTRYFALVQQSLPQPQLPDVTFALLRACALEGYVGEQIPDRAFSHWDTVAQKTGESILRAWTSATGIPAISDLARFFGRSGRQLTRNLEAFAHAIGLPSARWRFTMRKWRLRSASILLSAPRATVQDVAREVGYGSVEAMGRAFRDAGLPSPSDIRNAARGLIGALDRERFPSATSHAAAGAFERAPSPTSLAQ
jgi:AraC-like DNA-binding protein